jgi:hypothetical protein
MNVFTHFLYRRLWWDNFSIIDTYAEKLWWPDKYDEWLAWEVNKYSQIDFINWLEKEIESYLRENSNPRFTPEERKAGLLKILLFDTYVSAYMWKIESDRTKDKLRELFDYIELYHKDLNTLALSSLRDFRRSHMI